jgi:metal-responsive CopG/Arc/MetJ family transcriptional regulator
MKIDFKFDLDQDKPGGILVYKVQRKGNTRSNHRSKVIDEALRMMRLLVTWRIKSSGHPKVRVMLVEYNNESTLNEDELVQLYEAVNNIPLGYDTSHFTWLMCDNTVLKAICEIVTREGTVLRITISKGFKNEYVMKPMWIDSER